MADIESQILIRILDAFTAPLRQLQTGLDGAADRATKFKNAFRLAADLNQAAEGAGRFGNLIRAPLESAVNEFRGFEKQMSQVAALSGEIGTEGFDKMRAQALELGAATAFSSEEAAAAMAQYAQAGRDVNEILQITPMTLAAAKANGTGLAETAAIIGHTMSGMGIETSKTAHVVDVLTAAAAGSDASLQDLGGALAYVGPQARQTGTSLELTTALLGKLKDAGLEASMAGTGLRAVFGRLLDPTKQAEKAFAALGIKAPALKALQQSVATGHIDDALRKIGEAAAKLPNERRLKLLSDIFGLEASTAANIAISASIDTSPKGLGAFEKSLHQVDGTAERLAGVMTDNLDGALERAGGAVSGLKTKVGEILKPTVESAAGSVERLAGRMTKWTAENPRAAKATLELVAGLGALSLGLKGSLLAASTFVSAAAMAEKSFVALSGSLIGRLGLVAAAGAAGYAIGTWVNETFELDKRISAALGRGGPAEAGHKGLKPGETQVYAGGWTVSGGSGEVLTMGRGPGPAIVQRARAAGAQSLEQINEFIRQSRLTEGMNAELGEGTLLERQARGAARNASPLLEEGPGRIPAPLLGAGGVLPASVGAQQAAAFTQATREQTDALLETLRKSEQNTRDIADELRRSRPRPTAPGGVGAF